MINPIAFFFYCQRNVYISNNNGIANKSYESTIRKGVGWSTIHSFDGGPMKGLGKDVAPDIFFFFILLYMYILVF